jgi:hypothetical protein
VATTLASPTLALDLNLRQGEGATISLTTVDRLGAVITNPTGYLIRAQIRRTSTGPVLFEWNSAPATGQGTATLTYDPGPPAVSTTTLVHTGAESALWTFRLASWDCYLMAPGQEPACLAAGVVRVAAAITH